MTDSSNHDSLAQVEHTLLQPAELSLPQVTSVLESMQRPGIDYADLYFQHSQQEAWTLDDGIIREGSFNIESGVGIRAISGEKTGFAYSDAIGLPALKQAAGNALAIARIGLDQGGRLELRQAMPQRLYAPDNPIDSRSAEDKVELLKQLDAFTRSLDPRIEQVIISLSGSLEHILIAASDGDLAADLRPMVRLTVMVLMHDQGRREQGIAGGGGRHDYAAFFDSDLPFQYAREAVRIASVNLRSEAAPAGAMPVVLGPGWPGVLLHEAVGHGLEGDFNRKGTSTFSGRIGERVASPGVTVVDDSTLERRRGSLSVDDEGVPAQSTTLIEDGILRGYMQDKLNARLMGAAVTANGRRESYAHLPMPRMTNTYMLPGEADPEEIIASVDKGIYAVNFGGGQVDITSGRFVFSLTEAYAIEHGKLGAPIKGATLIGSGPEVMQRISLVGNDLELDAGVGVCGKDGQSVPVGVGQPTLKIDEITVGGTES